MSGMQLVFEDSDKKLGGNLFGCNWVSFDIVASANKIPMDMGLTSTIEKTISLKQNLEQLDLPSEYCSITITAYQWQEKEGNF